MAVGPGRYERTEAVRARNRVSAYRVGPCKDGCTCAKHYPHPGQGGKKCLPGCHCLRHRRTPEHNARIGMSVSLTARASDKGFS